MRKPPDLTGAATTASTGDAFARIGLLGNPSDAYRGKAIALSLYEFSAGVRLVPHASRGRFVLPEGLAHDLIAATCARYAAHAELPRNHDAFEIEVESSIPFQVGLAGSSALVIACLRGLGAAFERRLDPFTLSELALAVEVVDLGIAAGPMDRAIQAYEGALHMNFSDERSPASYTKMDRDALPPLLVAWDPGGGEESGRVHNDIRERWLRGEPEVVAAMREFADLVDTGMDALRARDAGTFRRAVDRNFDARCALFDVSARDLEMVEVTRSTGAAAKLCGSGGAIVAVLGDASDAAALSKRLSDAGYSSLVPRARKTEAAPA